MGKVFGIDLGTTYSCIAYIDENGKPVVLKNAEGDLTIPSAVFFETQTDVTVGSAAKEYRTVVTKEPITLYRVYGGDATMEGSYCTTEPCTDKEKARNDLALKSSWGNTIEKEAEIVVPAGTKLNIGRVEEQSDGTKTLTGNADQVLLPQNWNQDWVNKVRDID